MDGRQRDIPAASGGHPGPRPARRLAADRGPPWLEAVSPHLQRYLALGTAMVEHDSDLLDTVGEDLLRIFEEPARGALLWAEHTPVLVARIGCDTLLTRAVWLRRWRSGACPPLPTRPGRSPCRHLWVAGEGCFQSPSASCPAGPAALGLGRHPRPVPAALGRRRHRLIATHGSEARRLRPVLGSRKYTAAPVRPSTKPRMWFSRSGHRFAPAGWACRVVPSGP